ncbi:MAG: lipopolysaccharide kinase InaA family protein [Planctomycetota bacterium]|nr:lipopolysaccharide kinase InaA family protein [Planctomycetota bacterium]
MTALLAPQEYRERLAESGLRTLQDVVDQATCIRDLRDRSNLELEAGALRIFVKREKRRRSSREAEGIARAQQARVPTAEVVFRGVDPELGAFVGTLDLAPARPLDDLLREAVLSPREVRRVFAALADAVASLHDARLNHRDLYLCHVFARMDDDGAQVALIDFERLRKHRRLLGPRVVKDLAAMFSSIPEGTTSKHHMARFLLRYMRRRGIPRRGVYPGLARRVRRTMARIQRHVPQTPVGQAARPTDSA